MKKLFCILLIIMMMVTIFTANALANSAPEALPATADAPTIQQAAIDLAITTAVQVVGTLLITLIGILGTWLTLKIGKNEQLKNINAAQKEVIRLAKITVGELQQTVVDDLKEKAADGKLTKQEIAQLGRLLLDKTIEKMSDATYELLEAARVDVRALITGAAEDWIHQLNAPVVTEVLTE